MVLRDEVDISPGEPPPDDPHRDSDTEATRYLCVAAYTDEEFTDRVLSEVCDDELRAVAPSVGFDLAAVLRHCLHARRRRQRRDTWLVVLGGVAVLLSPLSTLVVGAAMAFGTALAPFRPTRHGPAGPLLGVLSVAMVSLLVLLQISLVSPSDGGLADLAVGRPWLALLFGVAAWLVLVGYLMGTRQLLVMRLRRDLFDPAPRDLPQPGRFAARLAAVAEAQRGNVTVYGGYAPFVGHGTPVAGWSFALPILPVGQEPGLFGPGAGGDRQPALFTVVDLIDHVRQRLTAIRWDPAGDPDPDAGRLAGLRLEDRVFVGGHLLTGDARLLPDRARMPRQRWSHAQVLQVAAHPQGAARHYLCAVVPSWGGEVVASTFLHFSTDGRVLYLECARTVLEPPRLAYHDVDRLPEVLPPSQFAQLLATATERLLRTALGAPGRLLRDLVAALRRNPRQARLRRAAQEDLGYDYGTRVGVRELAAGSGYHNYFQVLDAAKHLKVVERHVLAAIVDFLDERGVDTAEFRIRQTTILNQGVIQTGGLSVVGNQAVGTGAQAQQQTTGTAAPRARRAGEN
ncbi:hypothetical protein GA0070616_5472 [Micromonospora nigra]|uniref:Uncharacterized protein n=1 Tax=Micromonospora nigra TaxID=145857 RepID=A0A1C6T3S1_9ACTN|nr:hypothetical protein [Micromonospora nigra]SCL36381.1 hypothetical protein GA0070616_5472 [Micromonospora nigra]